MQNLENMTAAQILLIPVGEPERLFSGKAGSLRKEYAVLAKIWHPDRNKGAEEAKTVFEHIAALYDVAGKKLDAGTWTKPGILRIDTVEGKSFELKIVKRREFELGETAIAMGRVAYVVEKDHVRLFENGLRQIEGVQYPDAKIKADISRFMPKIERLFETEKQRVAVMTKTEDVMPLEDLIAHLGGAMPPKHAAWVVSSLLNLVCFFSVTGLTHNAMSPSTVFVSPTYHAAFPLGGWWYAAKAGDPITMLPEETFSLLPGVMAKRKQADIRLDLESVRAIGRAALGDLTGLKLVGRADLPKPMVDFLRLPSSGSAIEDYGTWERVLKDSFGPRRFVELPITSSDIYV